MPNEKAPRKCCPGPGSPFLAGIDRGHCKDEKQVSDHISCLTPPALGGTITVSSKPVPILRTLGLQLQVLYASSERDFNLVFARLVELRASGLVNRHYAQNPDCAQPTRPAQIRLESGSSRPTI
jgi:hypothetical protein